LDYRRSNLLNWRAQRQEVAQSEVRPWTAYLSGRQFSELRRNVSVIVGWDFYVQDVRYLAMAWMPRSLFGSVSFSPSKRNELAAGETAPAPVVVTKIISNKQTKR
jgi:hypothetical protein